MKMVLKTMLFTLFNTDYLPGQNKCRGDVCLEGFVYFWIFCWH